MEEQHLGYQPSPSEKIGGKGIRIEGQTAITVMVELSEIERERIKLEELYRMEIHSQLAASAAQSMLSKILAFFNTNLGLWLLSAVLLAGLATVWTKYWANQENRISAAREISRLDVEIGFRFAEMIGNLRSRSISVSVEDITKFVFTRPTEYKEGSGSIPVLSLYDDYSKYNLIGLVAEDRRRIGLESPNDPDLVRMHKVLVNLSLINRFFERYVDREASQEGQNRLTYNPATAEQNIISEFFLPRWREAFYPETR